MKTTPEQYVAIAKVVMEQAFEPGCDFEDMLATAGAAAKIYDLDDIDAVYELLCDNASPCWLCGKGIGDNRVEYFEGWRGETSFYAHPTCEAKQPRPHRL